MSYDSFKTIMADPPWPERGGGSIKRGADRHYNLMTIQEIIDIGSRIEPLLSPEGCHLYLWTTNKFVPQALKVMEAWGFQYVTTITWFKMGRIGMGQYFRGVTEPCLFGTRKGKRGRLPYKLEDGKRCQGETGFLSYKNAHSVKPKELREMAQRVSYPPRLELFARQKHPNWICWGDEIESDIELIPPAELQQSYPEREEG